jgi:branched-chain amino acid transport system ATP-binding protein
VREVGDALAALKTEMSILLVEQNLGLALRLADDLIVLNTGRVAFAGSREQFNLRATELQAHLGVH